MVKGYLVAMGRIMFDIRSFEAKNRVLKFDYQKMFTFKSI